MLTTQAPDELDFNDYILITPVANIPAIYVYLSEVPIDKITFDSKMS
ncbi:S-type pyocin domain-containing protein [Morganella morganii]|nr:S-type pyocin domain-containing protein [Morganella morganii]